MKILWEDDQSSFTTPTNIERNYEHQQVRICEWLTKFVRRQSKAPAAGFCLMAKYANITEQAANLQCVRYHTIKIHRISISNRQIQNASTVFDFLDAMAGKLGVEHS